MGAWVSGLACFQMARDLDHPPRRSCWNGELLDSRLEQRLAGLVQAQTVVVCHILDARQHLLCWLEHLRTGQEYASYES
jgi:hypothetical protein